MASDMKQNFAAISLEVKATFFNQLMANDLFPLDAIDATEFIRAADAKTFSLKPADLSKFKEIAKDILVSKEWENDDTSSYKVGDYQLDYNRGIKYWLDPRTAEQLGVTPKDIAAVKKINIYECIQMAAVMLFAEKMLLEKLNELAKKHGIDMATVEFIMARNSVRDELLKLAMSMYVRPKIKAILQNDLSYSNQQKSSAAVFAACESQLSQGNLSAECRQVVNNLVDGTVEGLAGNFDMQSYTATINSLPHGRDGYRILIGAAYMFAGALLIGAAIAAMVLTSGASTPLTLLSITLGIEIIIAGTAAAGVIGLAAGGFGAFFVNTKPEKAEVTKALEPPAIEFSKYKRGPAGG